MSGANYLMITDNDFDTSVILLDRHQWTPSNTITLTDSIAAVPANALEMISPSKWRHLKSLIV